MHDIEQTIIVFTFILYYKKLIRPKIVPTNLDKRFMKIVRKKIKASDNFIDKVFTKIKNKFKRKK